MQYQLIIKFWRKSLEDEGFLTTIDAELKQALGSAVELEGYDISPKEINLFMMTAEPKDTFRRVRAVLEKIGVVHGVSAAYRLVGGARFTSLWPLRSTRKFTLP
jgi:DNA-binding Lrp family transcriptional regulator